MKSGRSKIPSQDKLRTQLTKKIDEIISKMPNLKKLIRPVDRSAGGWMTVKEYTPNDLAIDSDDSRKMCQVETRTTKKKKLPFPRKLLSTFSSIS